MPILANSFPTHAADTLILWYFGEVPRVQHWGCFPPRDPSKRGRAANQAATRRGLSFGGLTGLHELGREMIPRSPMARGGRSSKIRWKP